MFNKKGVLSCYICGYEMQMPNHKPTTNADRIRAMTDEELAEWLFSITEDNTPNWHKWVKQEVDT